MVKFQVPNSITFRDMNYYPVTDGQTDRRTDGQKAMHKSPPCNMHRWAQKSHRRTIHCKIPVFVASIRGSKNPQCLEENNSSSYKKVFSHTMPNELHCKLHASEIMILHRQVLIVQPF